MPSPNLHYRKSPQKSAHNITLKEIIGLKFTHNFSACSSFIFSSIRNIFERAKLQALLILDFMIYQNKIVSLKIAFRGLID